MNRLCDRWGVRLFSEATLASGGMRSRLWTKASYRGSDWNRRGSKCRENGRSPKANEKASELTSTAAATGPRNDGPRRASPENEVPIDKGDQRRRVMTGERVL